MINLKEHASLKEHSTMKIGGSARYLIEIKDKAEIADAVAFAKENNLPMLFVGGGSNILFDDIGFHGLVIKISHKGIEVREEVLITAEAGESWDDFVKWTLDQNLFGLENLSGIPGCVGGAPIQNIGAYGVEAKDLIDSVEVFDAGAMKFKNLNATECSFAYRDSVFKKPEGKNLIVTAVTFKLSKQANVQISYKDLAHHFLGKIIAKSPAPYEVREAVLLIRSRKFPDLGQFGTAGSFFKNVICDSATAERLKAEYPDLPVFDAPNGRKKLSTAFILDKICGLKGTREGGVGLYENQSLVVVNYGIATSADIKRFISKIKNIVKEKTGISLEEEVVIL